MRALLLLLALAMATPAPAADVGGPFELPATSGGRLGDRSLAGRPYALFFGFTYCAEVCPMTLSSLSIALDELGAEADDLAVLFVTVDPERDTLDHLATYLAAFDPRIAGLSGTPAETLAVAQAFKATYRKVPLGGGDYSMDHTAIVYLMGADGSLQDNIAYGEDPDIAAAKLRRLVARDPA